MRCERFRTDPATLIEALAAAPLLDAWLEAQQAELAWLADRTLTAHLRRLTALAGRARSGGITLLARQDAAGADALLTDLFAVATWRRWELPVERLDDGEVEVGGLQRGLLGADLGGEGAGLWLIDHATVALARSREAGEADWHSHHPRAGGQP
jgi:hypothetical protein